MKNYDKYLIEKQKSRENLLKVLDPNDEWGEQRNDTFHLGIDTILSVEDMDRKTYPILIYKGEFEYDAITISCMKKCLVGKDKKIIKLLEKDLAHFEINASV